MALALGKTLGELRSEMTVDELALWWAKYRRDPGGQWRDDIRESMHTAAVCQAHGAKVKWRDLMPQWEPDPVVPAKTKAQQIRAWVTEHNKRKR